MLKDTYTTLARYSIALVTVAAALLLTYTIEPLRSETQSPLFFAAVVTSAWLGGIGPGLLATALSTLAIDFFFLPPVFALNFDLADLVRLSAFLLVAVLISWLTVARNKKEAERERLIEMERGARKEAEQTQKLISELLAREQTAREEAERASRAKDEFLATISHELRTPLNAMLGWAGMLRAGKLDAATSTRALEIIERNARTQAQLIEDILDVSRIITGRLRLNVTPVDLSTVIQAAIDIIRPAADAKEIKVEPVIDPIASPFPGDPNRLQQIVWNLLSNAVKFTPRGGRVQLRLERIDSLVEITVSDTGQGISPEFLPYVFERFRQADSSFSRKHGGLGLGLAIVRHLAELHGGSVEAFSDGKDRGATFKVRLPLVASRDLDRPGVLDVESKDQAAYGALHVEYSHSLEGLSLLVVEDEADARELLVTILEQRGAHVRAVATVGEAIEAIKQARPDLILSDIEMPGEDGYSLIRKVRLLDGELNSIPAVALTAHTTVEDRNRALSAGFQSHLAKPVNPKELVAVIVSFTRKRRAV